MRFTVMSLVQGMILALGAGWRWWRPPSGLVEEPRLTSKNVAEADADFAHRPQRNAEVCTGASQRPSDSSSRRATVREQPAISSEVT
jgi:hypothetical protein